MGSCSDVAPTIARPFLGRSPATRPITAPADGSAYGSQTPGVVQRNSHSTMSAGAAWSANEQAPIGKGRGMTDRRGSARMVAMTMATLGLAAGVLIGVVMVPSRQARGQDASHQGPWTIHIERMDQALSRWETTAAERARSDDYR